MPEIIIPENSVHPLTRAEWRAWLATNHNSASDVWLISYKKAANKPAVTYDEAVEEALCFGWVDSKPGKLDDERSMLYFSPRKPSSGWSRPNKQRVERLLAAGMMTPAGLSVIEAAKQNGAWERLDAVEDLLIPDDLADALASQPPAAANFDSFPRSVKRGILEWIVNAKRPETRAKRIEETARLAALNQRANQWRG